MQNQQILPSLSFDTPELAVKYDAASDYQFDHGKILIEALNFKPGETVLDIGAGTGRLGVYVAGLVGPTGSVIGIDPLPHRVALAAAKECPNFDARIGRAEDLSEFDGASFDVVYLNSVFHWIDDKPGALREIYRVLKPGGRVGLNSQDSSKPHEVRLLIGEAAEATVGIGYQRADPTLGVDAIALGKLMTGAGFVEYDGRRHTLKDTFADVPAIIEWMASSSFGNFMTDVTPEGHAAMEARLKTLLEPKRTAEGYKLDRYLVFATARKPV
jgi:arsenite methyltransferase